MSQSSRHLHQSVSKPIAASNTQSHDSSFYTGTTTHENKSGQQIKAANAQATEKKQEVYFTVEHIDVAKTRMSSGEQKLFLRRIGTAKKAETFFRKLGVTNDKAIIAILVNAWHECKWDYTDKSGNCIGFFQLLRGNGMGRGYSVAQLQDLNINMSIMAASTSFKAWTKWVKANPGVTAGEMSYRFAANVERCATKHRAPRRTTADRWSKALIK
jgi:hypothetical protein